MAQVSGAPRDPTAVVGRRITAYLIDGLLVSIALVVVLTMVKHDSFSDAPGDACSILRARHAADSYSVMCVRIASRAWLWKRSDFLIAVDVAAIIGILNLVVLQAVTGASAGKHVLGLVVVDEQGLPAGFGRMIVRWLLLIVDAGIFLIGLISMLTTRFHRRIGDLAAGTYVIGKVSAGRPIAFARPSIPYGGPVFAAPAAGPGMAAGVPVLPVDTPPAPGWGVTQPSPPPPVPTPVASSPWSAPPTAPPPAPPAPAPSMPPPPARPAPAPAAPAPSMPAPPPAPPPAPSAPVPTPRTYIPPETARPPAPSAPSPVPSPPVPSPPAPRPAAAPPALPQTKPPERQPVPQPESWWDTAVPNDPPDGEEQP